MGAHILIVEDSSYSLELMSYLLTMHGHTVCCAATGAEALAAADIEPVELILLDLQLPGIDGYQVLRSLRSRPRLAGVKIVAVTAVAMVGDRERTLAAGFDHYMSKPINPSTFVHELDGWLPRPSRSSPRDATTAVPFPRASRTGEVPPRPSFG